MNTGVLWPMSEVASIRVTGCSSGSSNVSNKNSSSTPDVLGFDSTTVKVHRYGTGPLKRRGPQAIGRSRGGLTTKIHMVAADARHRHHIRHCPRSRP